MARIRSIKPEMPGDEKLATVSRDARLTFILAWTQADDEGLLSASPRQLIGALFPLDDSVSVELLDRWIAELITIGRCRWRYTTDGARVLEVVNWKKHQKIDKPSPSKIRPLLVPLANSPRIAIEAPASRQRIEREVEVEVGRGDRSGAVDLCETEGQSTAECGEVPQASPANSPPLSLDKGNHDSNTARAVRDFLGHFYPTATGRRKADVQMQLADVLTASGTPFDGSRVRAVDGRHLRDVLLEVTAAPPNKRDVAIQWVLLKLRETYTETVSARHKEPRRPINPDVIHPAPTNPVLIGGAVAAVVAGMAR